MGVQIAIEEGEERELGNGLNFALVGRDGAGGGPEPVTGVDGRGRPGQGLDAAVKRAGGATNQWHVFQRRIAGQVPSIADHGRLRQIAQDEGHEHRQQTGNRRSLANGVGQGYRSRIDR